MVMTAARWYAVGVYMLKEDVLGAPGNQRDGGLTSTLSRDGYDVASARDL
jgi:hypothetical protein